MIRHQITNVDTFDHHQFFDKFFPSVLSVASAQNIRYTVFYHCVKRHLLSSIYKLQAQDSKKSTVTKSAQHHITITQKTMILF